MTQDDLERFRAWCLGRYSKRSSTKLVADVRTMVRTGGEPPLAQQRVKRLKDYAWAWDVWNDARADGCKLPELKLARPEVPEAPKRGGRRAREPKRLREARAMTTAEWEAMLTALEGDSSMAARVVEIMARTGLRVGDVLRVRLAALRTALPAGEAGELAVLVKGEKPTMVKLGAAADAWRRAYASSWRGAVTIADAVTGKPSSDTEASGAAYERCRRVMKHHGAVLAVDGRIHLHRLRRTVAIELLRRGASIEDVQQALLQESVKTTERSYTDEYRAEQAASALNRLRK
jgi:integrase